MSWVRVKVPLRESMIVEFVGSKMPAKPKLLARSSDMASLWTRNFGRARKARSEPRVKQKPRIRE